MDRWMELSTPVDFLIGFSTTVMLFCFYVLPAFYFYFFGLLQCNFIKHSIFLFKPFEAGPQSGNVQFLSVGG